MKLGFPKSVERFLLTQVTGGTGPASHTHVTPAPVPILQGGREVSCRRAGTIGIWHPTLPPPCGCPPHLCPSTISSSFSSFLSVPVAASVPWGHLCHHKLMLCGTLENVPGKADRVPDCALHPQPLPPPHPGDPRFI